MLQLMFRNAPSAMVMAIAMMLSSLLWPAALAGQAAPLDEARRLLREGQIESALAVIEQRLAADKTDRHARFLKGVALAEKSDTDSAIEIFVALTRDHPQLPEPYNNLAVLYASKNDFERARDALLQAINTHPSYATAHENLGDIYAKMAGLAYARALSLDIENAAAKDKLALIDDLFAGPAADAAISTSAVKPASKAVATAVASAAVPRAVDEPVRAPLRATTAPPADAASDGVLDAVQAWALAWASQDVERYLEHYAPGQSPDASMSRERWEQSRRRRLTKPRSVSVDVENVQFEVQGREHVVVTFEQSYRSDSYADRVRKRLTMTRIGNSWKISDERTVAKL